MKEIQLFSLSLRFKSIFVFALLTTLMLPSCEEPEKPDFTQYKYLRLRVIDNRGNLVEGAKVTLYNTEEDFRHDENPVGETIETGPAGYAYFERLDGFLIRYYVNIENGTFNNWYQTNEIEVTSRDHINEITLRISDDLASRLVGRNSTGWKQTKFTLDGNEIFGCIYSLVHRFHYSGITYLTQSEKCGSPGADFGSNVWTVNNEETGYFTGSPSGRSEKIITQLGDDFMEVTYPEGRFTIVETYEKVD